MADKKTQKQKDVARFLRERDRARLRELREEIRKARARRRQAVAAAVQWCREGRAVVRERAQSRRLAALLVLRERAESERAGQRTACAARKAAARATTSAGIAAASRELKEERAALAIQARRYSGKKSRVRATERRQESDQEVERDIPPELVPLWRKTKRHLKPTARMSRAEQFMKWAEDNPGEVLDAQADAAERDVERLVREHAAQDRKMRDRKRYRRSAEEITAELAKEEDSEEVPF